MSEDIPKLLSVDEAAAMMRVSRRFVYSLLESGEISSTKLGERRLVYQSSIADLIARNTVEARGP